MVSSGIPGTEATGDQTRTRAAVSSEAGSRGRVSSNFRVAQARHGSGLWASVCLPALLEREPGALQRLCGRCGASMESFLQESGGLRRTAPVQSPVPVSGRLPLARRLLIGCLVVLLVLAYLLYLLPAPAVRFAIATAAAGGV